MIECDFCGAITRIVAGKCTACGRMYYANVSAAGEAGKIETKTKVSKAGLSAANATGKTNETDVGD